MNTTFETRFARTVLAASIGAIFSVPAAWADDEVEDLIRPDSHVELGVGYVSEDSFKFGKYTGLHEQGGHLIGNFEVNKRGEGDARYLGVVGRNLGLDSRSLGVRAGEQGNYGVRLEYDEIPHLISDSYQTPYLGAGTTVLTRPAGVTRAGTVTAMTGLAENMKSYDIKTKRKGLGLGFTKELADGWDVELTYKREDKDGDRLTAAVMQTGTGGSRGVVILPEPIDYTTDQYEALTRYTGKKLQLQFGYYASLFNNSNQSVSWDNLFTGSGNATGRYALAPDNEFHQVNASGSYALTGATTVSGSLSFGRMTQNDSFLPYSTAGATLPERLPTRSSLDGKVYTTNAYLKLNTKLMPKLNLTAGMRYDDRDNKTAISQFDYITADRNDPTAQPTATNALRRLNMPLDVRKRVVFADVDYHLASATTLKFGYDYHDVRHNYEPTTGDKEHTVKTEVRHQFSETVLGGVNYAHSDRDASTYNGAAPLASTYSAAYLRTLCSSALNPVLCSNAGATGKSFPWLEAPTLRKYFLTDRKRDKVGTFANYSPVEQLDMQFVAQYTRDKYPDALDGIGLTKATGWLASFDATLQATDALSGSFFASVDQYKTDQNGAHLPDATLARAAELGTIPATNMVVTTLTDRTVTVGLGMLYKPMRKYEVGTNFTHSYSTGSSTFTPGATPAALTLAPLPDLESKLNRLEMFGRYFLQKDLSLNLKYAYERYRSADWAWDAPLALNSVTGVVGTNQVSPNYNVHFVGVSVAYQF